MDKKDGAMKGENTYKAIMACLALLLGGLGCAIGQEVLKIEGCVRDSLGDAVPYATVVLWQGAGEVAGQTLMGAADSLKLVGGSVTDTSGYYSLEVPKPGRYLLQCKHIVYRSVWQEAEIGSGSAGELDFVLAPDGEMLEEVEVKGTRIRFTAGEYKINLSESSVVKNRTMSETLNLLPGLVYKDGKLLLDGQAVSVIYLDGRELQSAEQLRWLNGEDIENVEVQNQAGSAYSSTLRGGIVRIETKKKEGYSLDLILNPYYGPSAKKADSYGVVSLCHSICAQENSVCLTRRATVIIPGMAFKTKMLPVMRTGMACQRFRGRGFVTIHSRIT